MSSSPRMSLTKIVIVFSVCAAMFFGSALAKSAPSISATGKNSHVYSGKSAQPAAVEDQIQEESHQVTETIHMQAPSPPKGSSSSPVTSGSSPQPKYKNYPLHSDVVQAGSDSHYTKTPVSPGFHNEMIKGLVEVFGLALVPILLLPVVGLALCYLLWSSRNRHGQHYAFDNGLTYGGGAHSSVVGYDYSNLHKKNGLERANNELTQRILPHL